MSSQVKFLAELNRPEFYVNLTDAKTRYILDGMKVHGLVFTDIKVKLEKKTTGEWPALPLVTNVIFALFCFGSMRTLSDSCPVMVDIVDAHRLKIPEDKWLPLVKEIFSVSVETQTNKGNSACDRFWRIEDLLRSLDLEYLEKPHQNLIWFAVRYCSKTATEWLLDQGVDLISPRDKWALPKATRQPLQLLYDASQRVNQDVTTEFCDIFIMLLKAGLTFDYYLALRFLRKCFGRSDFGEIIDRVVVLFKEEDLNTLLLLLVVAHKPTVTSVIVEKALYIKKLLAFIRAARSDINVDLSEFNPVDSQIPERKHIRLLIDYIWDPVVCRLSSVFDLMSVGSLSPRYFDQGVEMELQDIAVHRQSAHVPAQVRLLRSIVNQVKFRLQDATTRDNSRKHGDVTHEKVLRDHLRKLGKKRWQRIKTSVSAAKDREIDEIQESVFATIHRVCNDIAHGGLVNPSSDVFRVVCYGLVAEYEDRGVEYSFQDDILVPLAQQILYTANKETWGDVVCPVGTINDILQVLEGKILLKDRNIEDPDLLPDDLDEFKALLAKVRDAESDHVLIEAQQRLIESGAKSELKKIYDIMIEEPTSYKYAVNQLRGVFFRALRVEFAELLAKHTIPVEFDDEPEFVTQDMEAVIVSLGYVANVFTDVVVASLPGSLEEVVDL